MDGNYTFTNLDPDNFIIIEEQPADLADVEDGDRSDDGDANDLVYDQDNKILVTLAYGETDANNDFIEEQKRDYGDLPTSFGVDVVAAANIYNADLYLGTLWDNETEANSNSDATGDDNGNSDDEDGFINPTVLVEPGEVVVFKFNVTNNTGSDAYLKLFVDVDNSKSFDYDEIKEVTVGWTPNGSQTVFVSLTVPSDAKLGEQVFSRVRLSENPGATATGIEEGGEIEDYYVITPVPVDLISFTGKLVGSDVQLNWATASELNNDRFEVERRFEGETEFTTIGEVDGNGNSQEVLNYQFLDNNNNWPTEVAYYRLRQVDFDGAFEHTQIVAIAKEGTFDARVYPNPTKGVATVSIISDGKLVNPTFTIIDGFGKDVTAMANVVNLGGAYTINGTSLRNGIYFAEITTNNQKVVKRFMIAR